MTLQAGIYHAPGRRPGPLLRAAVPARGAGGRRRRRSPRRSRSCGRCTRASRRAGCATSTAWRWRPTRTAPSSCSASGATLFGLAGTAQPRPRGLGDEYLFRSAEPGGGGPLLRGSGLRYAPDVRANMATEHVCVQVIADTKLATDRAVVETWKALADMAAPALSVTTFYLGFQRNDRRSWIDFHDGLSNLRSADREAVIAIAPGADEDWAVGGTYLAFLRLAVDLVGWRRLTRADQEFAVGRVKLSGCPITAVGEGGAPVTDAGCPVTGTQIWEKPNDARVRRAAGGHRPARARQPRPACQPPSAPGERRGHAADLPPGL